MKDYSNSSRKPMMYGGMAKKKAMGGGMATSSSGMTSPTMVAQKAQRQAQQPRTGMGGSSTPPMTMSKGGQTLSDADRQKLIRRRAQLQKAVDQGNRPDDILQEMKRTIIQITDQLGESATPGRAPVDAPQGKMYGGMAKKKK